MFLLKSHLFIIDSIILFIEPSNNIMQLYKLYLLIDICKGFLMMKYLKICRCSGNAFMNYFVICLIRYSLMIESEVFHCSLQSNQTQSLIFLSNRGLITTNVCNGV